MTAKLTFAAWHAVTPDLPGWARASWFDYLTAEEQASCWHELGERCQLSNESAWLAESRFYEEWPPSKRHQPTRRSPAATSTKPGTVALSKDDPLKNIDPRVSVEALCGVEVPRNGWLRCPLPDHPDHTPSFQVLRSHWRCFGCGRGGGVIDLASALHGIEPRGRGYWRLRDLILGRLLWAPLNPKEDK